MCVPDKLLWHLRQEPTNDVYKKALDMTAQAPQLHAELQKQIAGSQVRTVMSHLIASQTHTSTAPLQNEACTLGTKLVLLTVT